MVAVIVTVSGAVVPSESVTTTCATYVPGLEYVWRGLSRVLVPPSPNVPEYVYGVDPPLTVTVKDTVSGTLPDSGLAAADAVRGGRDRSSTFAGAKGQDPPGGSEPADPRTCSSTCYVPGVALGGVIDWA